MSELSPQIPRSHEDPGTATALFFSGDTEHDWRRTRLIEFGERNTALTLMPMVKDGTRHDVVWLERSWMNPHTGKPEVLHHAACRCLAESSLNGDDEVAAMNNCSAWQEGVLNRAIEINHKLAVDFGLMLASAVKLSDVEHAGMDFADIQLDPVDEAMLFHLRTIKRQPKYWEGNQWEGQHQLHLLSVITGYEPNQLAEHAQGLAEAGWIDYDGAQTVRLAA